MDNIVHETRDAWLQAAVEHMKPWFVSLGHPITGKVRCAIGFPSMGALARKKRRIGEHWDAISSADGHSEIIVSPLLDDRTEILATLAHELAHAALGNKRGHKQPFGKLVTGLGLVGKVTATEAGEQFLLRVEPLMPILGKLPHAKLTPIEKEKKQTTRLLKCECNKCGYAARITRKWLEAAGTPLCPHDNIALTCDDIQKPGEPDAEALSTEADAAYFRC